MTLWAFTQRFSVFWCFCGNKPESDGCSPRMVPGLHFGSPVSYCSTYPLHAPKNWQQGVSLLQPRCCAQMPILPPHCTSSLL